ncbi:MAG TPA: arginine--tRNA ligase [Nitrososphaeraceae archaeon]|nr:arginine--tRNA ligase [Nitrososphaeraceae archaeon]
MTFRSLINNVREIVSLSAKKLGYISDGKGNEIELFDISEAPRKELGDITCNIAFKLSKRLKRHPYEIAIELVEKELNPLIQDHRKNREAQVILPSLSMLVSAEAHPAGYINFRLNFAAFAAAILKEIITDPKYGFYDIGNGKHAIIEHTSVNPNKALHVGHLRNVILGDTIYRMLKSTNHKTTVLNYVDDSGLQVADIVVGFKFAGFPIEPKKDTKMTIIKFDQYCGDEVYTKINKMYDVYPSLQEKRKYVLREIEDPRSPIAKFAADVTIKVLREQLRTCWRIHARYDLLNFESHIVSSGLWSSTLELLRNQGLMIQENSGKNKGCWIVRMKNGNMDLGGQVEEADKVILRSDGTSTYIAKDISYAAWKTGLVSDPFSYYKFAHQWDDSILWASTIYELNQNENTHPDFQSQDITITIIDSRQSRLQKIISYILSSLKLESSNHKSVQEELAVNTYTHLGYEAVTLSARTARVLGLNIGEREFTHMSGRKGIYINADYILDRLHEKALEEVRKRNPTFSVKMLDDIAEKIAVSSVRYYMIKHDLNKIISFDIVESLSLDGDSGPYLQYSYARAQRIIEKSGQDIHFDADTSFELLKADQEVELIKMLSKLDLILEEAVVTLNPKTLARYGHELAATFNFYYEKIPILKEKNRDMVLSRLILVHAYGIVLKKVFDFLGIDALRKM